MNVCIITNTYTPEFGAAPARWEAVAKELCVQGHQVLVVTTMPNYPTGKIHPAYRGKWFVDTREGKLRVLRCWSFPSHSKNVVARFASMFSQALTMSLAKRKIEAFRPDWVLVQHPPPVLALVALYMAQSCKAKLAVNYSDLWSEGLRRLTPHKNSLALRFVEWVDRLMATRADVMIAQNQEIVAYLAEKHGREAWLMRTGVDCEQFGPKLLVRAEQQPLRLVYAGVLGMAHGMAAVCKHIDFHLLRAELHIYGDGCELAEIRQIVAANPNRGIWLHQPVSLAEMPKVLQQYDAAFVSQQTHLPGTVPSKIYEAMSSELPILFLGAGEGASLIKMAQCGVCVAPNQWQALQKQIRKLAQMEPKALQAIGRKGRAEAVCFFDRKKQVSALISFLNAVELDSKRNLIPTQHATDRNPIPQV